MKKIANIFSLIALVAVMTAAKTIEPKGPRFDYVLEVIDLGVIYVDEIKPLKIDVEFVNSGDQPLIVSQARGCCGTRISSWTREPVRPGEKGVIVAEFTPGAAPHRINRTITSISNDPASTKIIRMQGEVAARSTNEFKPAPQGQAPKAN